MTKQYAINKSLTEDARELLEGDSSIFKVKDENSVDHYDGASYFQCIARLIDPDNNKPGWKFRINGTPYLQKMS